MPRSLRPAVVGFTSVVQSWGETVRVCCLWTFPGRTGVRFSHGNLPLPSARSPWEEADCLHTLVIAQTSGCLVASRYAPEWNTKGSPPSAP